MTNRVTPMSNTNLTTPIAEETPHGVPSVEPPSAGATGSRAATFALAAIVALAALVRFNHLADMSCTFDEAFCWKLTTFGFDQAWGRAALDNHPPLFFYLLLCWSSLFGDTIAVSRSLSVLIGLGGVAAAYLFVRQVESRRAPRRSRAPAAFPALLAAAFMALSPFQIDWSQQVRMYALGSTLTLFSCWLLVRALDAVTPRWQDYGPYAATAALLAYTHYFGLFVLAAQFLYACGCCFRQKARLDPSGRRSPDARFSMAGHVLWAFCAIAALWLPWLPEFLRHRERVAGLFWTGPFEWEKLAGVCCHIFAVSWAHVPEGRWASWTAGGACLLFSIGALSFSRGGLRLIGLGVLVTLGGAGLTSISLRNIVVPHYFIFCHALLICGIAIAAARLPGVFRELVCLALFLAVSALCLKHMRLRDECAERPGMMAAMAYLSDVRKRDEPVLVLNPMVQTTAMMHAARPEFVQVLTDSRPFPYFYGTAVMRAHEYISPATLQRLAPRRLWVIDAINWNSGSHRTQVPEPWVDVADEAFPEWIMPSCRIVVRRWERRPSASGAASCNH